MIGVSAVDLHFNEQEHACIKLLAEWFEQGKHICDRPQEVISRLGINEAGFVPLMRTMEEYGIIGDPAHTSAGRFSWFKIKARAVQMARALAHREKESQVPQDIVDQVQKAVRRWPLTAWVIIVFLALTVLATFVNQTLGILKNLGVLP